MTEKQEITLNKIVESMEVLISEVTGMDETKVVDAIGFALCETGYDLGELYDEYMKGE